ncbi:MAG: hypothetical protein KDE34_00350 [Anaerolineales bacterium]|nr:hypothetical protein [Anaerolineales bacterium]
MPDITALVMVGAATAASTAIGWVNGARRAAAADLLTLLAAEPAVGRLLLATPTLQGMVLPAGVEHVPTPPGPIHLGRFLAELVEREQIEKLLYMGGGAAPLLTPAELAECCSWLSSMARGVVTNNRFASDWAGIAPANCLADHAERLPRDNMLGWVLGEEAGLPVKALAPNTATRLDIDTPLELVILQRHPQTAPQLRQFLAPLPLPMDHFETILTGLSRPASRWLISGRLAPGPWSRLNQVTQCWFRVLSEERGMVSSGRQTDGAAFSFFAAHLEAVGPERFWRQLQEQADGLLIDTRVMLAHHNRWPPDTDRFASDLLQPELVEDPWLRQFTMAAVTSGIPLLLGGHSLMAGALYAICDFLAGDVKI